MVPVLFGRPPQFVRTGSSTSSLARILCDIPQRSVLEPILFLLYTDALLLLTEGHGLWPHLYADDTQVYGLCRPSATLQRSISTCLDDVARWMCSNWLQLKTEVIGSTSSRRLHWWPVSPIRVGSDSFHCLQPRHLHGNATLAGIPSGCSRCWILLLAIEVRQHHATLHTAALAEGARAHWVPQQYGGAVWCTHRCRKQKAEQQNSTPTAWCNWQCVSESLKIIFDLLHSTRHTWHSRNTWQGHTTNTEKYCSLLPE